MDYSNPSGAAQEPSSPQRSEQSAAGQLDVLSADERELITEILRALRSMRYGSVVMTVHDGRLVEIQKTERIRRGTSKGKD